MVALWLALIGCQPRDPAGDAEQLIQSGQPEQAIDRMRAALLDRPGDAELSRLLGLALIRTSQPSLAIWPLRRAAEASGSDLEVQLLLARALQRGGDPVAAIDTATRVLEEDPENVRALAIRAESRLATLAEEAAIEDLETILDLEPDRSQTLQTLYNAHHKLEDFGGAMEVLDRYEQALAKRGVAIPAAAVAEICARRVELRVRMEQLDEARSQLDRCLEDHPTQPTVLDAALQLLDQLGESERATELLQQAAESKPESLTLQLNLARRFASFGQPDEAEEAMRSAAERIDEPDAWVALADLRVEWGNTRGAIQALDRAIEAETGASPGTPDFSYDEIDDRRLFAHGDLLLALAEIDRAREILAAIEEPVYRLLLEARIHHTAGDAERALDLYEESFLLWHSNPGARYLAAEAALEIDRVDDAIRHLRESVRADAAASEAGLLLARIHAAQGEPAAAAAALHLHVTAHPRDGEAVRMLAGLFDDADLGEEAEAIRERWRAIPGEAAAVEADQARRLAKSDGPEAALALLENEYGAALIERANAPALLAWTEIACEAGRGEEAEQRVRSAISRDPSSADLQAALGRCLLSRDRSDEAAMTLEKALTLDPDHLAAMRDRCLLRIFRRETGGAADACDGLTELGLQSIDARLAVSDEMAHAGLEALAIEQLESLIEDHPWLGPAALRIARLQLASGRVGEETLAHAERALRYPHGERPQALQTVGRVQHALGHPSNAVAPLLQSTRLAREDPLGWYYLGEVLLDLERRPEALDAYRAALSAGPFPLEETARRRIEELRPDAA